MYLYVLESAFSRRKTSFDGTVDPVVAGSNPVALVENSAINRVFPAASPQARQQRYWGLVAGLERSFQPCTTESDADSKWLTGRSVGVDSRTTWRELRRKA